MVWSRTIWPITDHIRLMRAWEESPPILTSRRFEGIHDCLLLMELPQGLLKLWTWWWRIWERKITLGIKKKSKMRRVAAILCWAVKQFMNRNINVRYLRKRISTKIESRNYCSSKEKRQHYYSRTIRILHFKNCKCYITKHNEKVSHDVFVHLRKDTPALMWISRNSCIIFTAVMFSFAPCTLSGDSWR